MLSVNESNLRIPKWNIWTIVEILTINTDTHIHTAGKNEPEDMTSKEKKNAHTFCMFRTLNRTCSDVCSGHKIKYWFSPLYLLFSLVFFFFIFFFRYQLFGLKIEIGSNGERRHIFCASLWEVFWIRYVIVLHSSANAKNRMNEETEREWTIKFQICTERYGYPSVLQNDSRRLQYFAILRLHTFEYQLNS